MYSATGPRAASLPFAAVSLRACFREDVGLPVGGVGLFEFRSLTFILLSWAPLRKDSSPVSTGWHARFKETAWVLAVRVLFQPRGSACHHMTGPDY